MVWGIYCQQLMVEYLNHHRNYCSWESRNEFLLLCYLCLRIWRPAVTADTVLSLQYGDQLLLLLIQHCLCNMATSCCYCWYSTVFVIWRPSVVTADTFLSLQYGDQLLLLLIHTCLCNMATSCCYCWYSIVFAIWRPAVVTADTFLSSQYGDQLLLLLIQHCLCNMATSCCYCWYIPHSCLRNMATSCCYWWYIRVFAIWNQTLEAVIKKENVRSIHLYVWKIHRTHSLQNNQHIIYEPVHIEQKYLQDSRRIWLLAHLDFAYTLCVRTGKQLQCDIPVTSNGACM
jgi:hypothetical protein